MKNFMKILPKIFTKRQANAGMGTLEMLLGGAMSLIILGAAGGGLASIFNSHKDLTNEIDRRIEVNRALDFMSEESQQARTIQVAGDGIDESVTLESAAPTFVNNVVNTTPSYYDYSVMLLNLPGVSERVIYYLESPPTNSVWRGPKVIYRWGPQLDADGNYIDANNPANWTSDPLIDRIDDTASNPNCPSGWLAGPGNGITPTGFHGCVSPDGKVITVVLNGQVNTLVGSSAAYEKDKTTLAMADAPPALAGTPPPIVSAAVPPSLIPNCSITNGVLSCDGPGTVTVEVLGSASACNPAKPFIVSTNISVDGQDQGLSLTEGQSHSLQVNSNAEVRLISTKHGNSSYPSKCRPDKVVVSDDPDPERVLILENGDSLPTEYEPMFDQNSIEDYVVDYLDNNTVVLNDNQIIYLYELAYNINNGNHDLQDNVVLVTIDAP